MPLNTRFHFIISFIAFALGSAHAADHGRGRAIQMTATVQVSPPVITLSWPARTDLQDYSLHIVAPDGTIRKTTVPAGSTGFADTEVTVGESYEYRVRARSATGGSDAYGNLVGGIHLPLSEHRGKVLLIVDATQATALANSLDTLRRDLIGDGWRVNRFDVSPDQPPVAVRRLIQTAYEQEPNQVKAVLLIGHIAVPYSGRLSPDGHFEDHFGAWPADVYYGELDRVWTDKQINDTTAARPENRNTRWDGKWDQSTITGVKLAVGRIDFSNLPAFAESEEQLLRSYLAKNHAYRQAHFQLEQRGFIQDRLSHLIEAPGSGAYRSMAACFGSDKITNDNWNNALLDSDASYAMSIALSTGNYTTCTQVTSTSQLATNDYRTGFAFLMGSYFGDWDSQNNLLRAALASGSHTVATGWWGRPMWSLHRLAMGETIGQVLLHTQNYLPVSNTNIGFMARHVHVSLLGDPTLRLHNIRPVTGVDATDVSGRPRLTWSPSPDADNGYHVYRAYDWQTPFQRLTDTPLSSTQYEDPNPIDGALYMVRALRVETGGSGTYMNASQGAFYEWQGDSHLSSTPKVNVTSLADTFHEAGANTATYKITRTGGTSQALTVHFTIGGVEAGVGVEPFASSIIIPAGETSATFNLHALPNETIEEDRAAALLLAPTSDYHVAWGDSAALITLQDRPFDQWRKTHFPNDWFDPSVAGVDADPDGDQMGNLIEFAAHCDPHLADTMVLDLTPAPDTSSDDTITFLANPNASDIELTLEQSEDCTTWNAAPYTSACQTCLDDGNEMRWTVPTYTTRKFYQLRAVLAGQGG